MARCTDPAKDARESLSEGLGQVSQRDRLRGDEPFTLTVPDAARSAVTQTCNCGELPCFIGLADHDLDSGLWQRAAIRRERL